MQKRSIIITIGILLTIAITGFVVSQKQLSIFSIGIDAAHHAITSGIYQNSGSKQLSQTSDTKTLTLAKAPLNEPEFAKIDESSLTSASGNPTITGSAGGIQYAHVDISPPNGMAVYADNHVQISNGRWSTNVSTHLACGHYTITVYDPQGAPALVTATLTITSQCANSSKIQPSATIDQSSLTATSANPILTGTLSGISVVNIRIWRGDIIPPNSDSGSGQLAIWSDWLHNDPCATYLCRPPCQPGMKPPFWVWFAKTTKAVPLVATVQTIESISSSDFSLNKIAQ